MLIPNILSLHANYGLLISDFANYKNSQKRFAYIPTQLNALIPNMRSLPTNYV